MILGKYIDCVYNLSLPKGERSHTFLDNDGGIYAIYVNEKLYYIGITNNFLERYSLHKSHILNGTGSTKLYPILREEIKNNNNIFLIPIMTDEDLKSINFTAKEMERSLIDGYQPKGNYEGINIKYRK